MLGECEGGQGKTRAGLLCSYKGLKLILIDTTCLLRSYKGMKQILNMILDGKFNEILKFSERVFRIALKPKNEWGKNENEFINENVKLEGNKNNLTSFSQKLFKLYALIEEEIKKKEVLR
jgi:hypothetical protein